MGRAVEHGMPTELVWPRRDPRTSRRGSSTRTGWPPSTRPERLRTTAVDANPCDVVIAEDGVSAVADPVDQGLSAG